MWGVLVKLIEGFFIKKYTRGTKKGTECIKTKTRYIWRIPRKLENEIQAGDEVLAQNTYWSKEGKYISSGKARVLVINVFEKEENLKKRKKVLKILKKHKR